MQSIPLEPTQEHHPRTFEAMERVQAFCGRLPLFTLFAQSKVVHEMQPVLRIQDSEYPELTAYFDVRMRFVFHTIMGFKAVQPSWKLQSSMLNEDVKNEALQLLLGVYMAQVQDRIARSSPAKVAGLQSIRITNTTGQISRFELPGSLSMQYWLEHQLNHGYLRHVVFNFSLQDDEVCCSDEEDYDTLPELEPVHH